jgi:hypothetical protein
MPILSSGGLILGMLSELSGSGTAPVCLCFVACLVMEAGESLPDLGSVRRTQGVDVR